MKYNLIVLKILTVVLTAAAVASCTRMDDYLKYTNEKELVYSGKVDSAFVYPGRDRVLIKGLLISDPKIVKVTVYWNSRAEKAEINIERSARVDTVKIPLNLPEGRYNFELFTFDKEGNSSIDVPVSGASYGSRYESSLLNRTIKSMAKGTGANANKVTLTLYKADETAAYMEITYTDSEDRTQVLKVENKAKAVDLPNIKSKSKIRYQTFYKPDKKAIDIFSAKPETVVSP